MRRLVAAIALLCGGPAAAEGVRDGWGVQFRQDVFNGDVRPLAIMAEEGAGIGAATLFVTCGAPGLVAFFQPGGYSAENSVQVDFRGRDGTRSYSFETRDVPMVGAAKALPTDATETLLALIESSGGNPVPFRSKERQGALPSIGAKEAFAIMREQCP